MPKNPSPPQETLTCTVAEVARRLGLGINQTYEAVRRGDIPSIRLGRRLLIPLAALNRMLEGKAA